MAYLHVIAKLRGEDSWICIFRDLTPDDLRFRFVRHYELGERFLGEDRVIDPKEIQSLKIIETLLSDAQEREAICEEHRQSIEALNRSSDHLVFGIAGLGWNVEDIAEAGEDVTKVYIKGAPGHLRKGSSIDVPERPEENNKGWRVTTGNRLFDLIVAVGAAGVVYFFGWN